MSGPYVRNYRQHTDDPVYTKLFVGGLRYKTTSDTLRKHFLQYGSIEEAVVIMDRFTGKSRGYGFVTMTDAGGADRACRDANPTIDGRVANVNLAALGARGRNLDADMDTDAPACPPARGVPPFVMPYPFVPIARPPLASPQERPPSTTDSGLSSPGISDEAKEEEAMVTESCPPPPPGPLPGQMPYPYVIVNFGLLPMVPPGLGPQQQQQLQQSLQQLTPPQLFQLQQQQQLIYQLHMQQQMQQQQQQQMQTDHHQQPQFPGHHVCSQQQQQQQSLEQLSSPPQQQSPQQSQPQPPSSQPCPQTDLNQCHNQNVQP